LWRESLAAGMKWELLVLSMSARKEFLSRLIENLTPQLKGRTNIDVRVRICDPRFSLGENRDMLLRSSQADYISFFDDDDVPAEDFVPEIISLLAGQEQQFPVDYIGFNVQLYFDGVPDWRITKHSLQFGGWGENPEFYWRDISHINPMRRELALLEPFEGGHGEDHRWADRMRARGVLKTEHYIPRTMYHYFFRSNKNRAGACPKCGSVSTVRVELGSACNGCGNLFNAHPQQKSCLWD
jgi:hypothetical protein